MKKIENKYLKAGISVGVVIGVVFCVGIIIGSNIVDMVTPTVEKERRWQMVYIWTPLAEGDPGAGASGFLEVFFINHSASPTTCYDENSSTTLEGWCTAAGLGYNTTDDFYQEIASEVSFDIVVRCRFNKTHVWESTKFIDSRADCQITTTCTSWADGENDANTSATNRVVSRNNTGEDYIWINFVWNADDNNGYQINDGATLTVTEIYIEAQY